MVLLLSIIWHLKWWGMQEKYSFVIVDTSCLILLANINEPGLLHQLFKTIVITQEIAEEFGEQLPDWVKIKKVSTIHHKILELDQREASALLLYMEVENALIILDDKKVRKLAERLTMNFTGSLGVFLKARQENLIPSVRSVLKKVQKTNFRFSNEVLNKILTLAGEDGV